MLRLVPRSALALCGASLVSLTCAHPSPPAASPPAAAASAAAAPAAAATNLAQPAPPEPELQLPAARAVTPVERSVAVELKPLARHEEGGYETLAFGMEGVCVQTANVWVEQREDRPRPWSGVGPSDGQTPRMLLIRRPVEAAADGSTVHLYTGPAGCNDHRGEHLIIALPDVTRMPRDRKALQLWARGLAAAAGSGSWSQFARSRLEELYFPPAPAPKAAKPGKGAARRGPLVTRPRRNPSEVARLMETTTGITSLQETLQQDRQLILDTRAEPATVPMAQLSGPPIAQHPWVEMMGALGRPVPSEPLAQATPADFYFVRFRALPDLLRVIDELDAWITPAGQVMSGKLEDRELAARLEAELGLGRGPLTRALGSSVVTDLAVVGSDPYLMEGSDLTLIFRLKSPQAFDTALAMTLAAHAGRHGGVTATSFAAGAAGDPVMVTLAQSPDGAIHQYRAAVGGYHLVSNSRNALLRVVETIKGKAPRMADEPDFRYMLARDAGVKADVLGFMSDRFVASVVGPRQKILEARRQVAMAELMAPGYASLLYGWTYGRAPRTADEVVASGLLKPSELRHGDGEAIAWKPGHAARSSWGTPRALTPLIDLKTPDKVTQLEKAAYDLFAADYQHHWRTYMDPVAVRLSMDGAVGGPMRVDVRVLPLIDGTDYDELARTVGDARLQAPPLQRGLRTVLGIGENAEIRRMLRRGARELPLRGRLDLDWLGDWAVLGLEDHAQAVAMLFDTDLARDERFRLPDEKQPRSRDLEQDMLDRLANLPIWAGIALRSSAPAAVFFSVIRHELESVAPGAIDWKEAGKHAGIPYVAIRASQAGRDMGGSEMRRLLQDLALYYAFCPGSLILSLSEPTLKRRLDECAAGNGPKTAAAGQAGGRQDAQWLVELGMQRGGPMWRGLGWIMGQLPMGGEEQAAATAEAVLRGAPGASGAAVRALALDVLGYSPLTAEGRDFSMTREGVTDPLRGSEHAPRRPALPVDGSPAARLLEQVQQARSEVAFDQEARVGDRNPRSLHVVLRLRGAKD